jgi:hypothetical protein
MGANGAKKPREQGAVPLPDMLDAIVASTALKRSSI